MKFTKKKILTLIILIIIFLIVYSPHLNNPFPIHIDEYHHITEAIKLKNGEYILKGTGVELGFHFFLLIISYLTNLTLTYKFLPAIWALISAITLFYIVKFKTKNLKNSYLIAIFSIIFFVSIKSNTNITGLWFFTPLTFSIPFIFLYIYLFSEGIQKQNKKLITASLIIIVFLIPIHSISVLFAIPFLIIYSLSNTNYINYLKREYKFFSIFIAVPILGILLYSQIMDLTIINSIKLLLVQLQFKQGWGVLELKNSFLELYSPIGYILAIMGFLYIISSRTKFKKYLIYILWPITLLAYILIFRLTGISPLSPYQRNLYYFAISLPFLSSLGLYSIIKIIKIKISNKTFYKTISLILIIAILILTFQSYYKIPENIRLYKTIDNNNYQALQFLSQFPPSKVMATAKISTAIFPITNKHKPVATLFFYGDRQQVENFFRSTDCQTKNQIITQNKVSYILSEKPINCNWEIIYNKNNNIIYKV